MNKWTAIAKMCLVGAPDASLHQHLESLGFRLKRTSLMEHPSGATVELLPDAIRITPFVAFELDGLDGDEVRACIERFHSAFHSVVEWLELELGEPPAAVSIPTLDAMIAVEFLSRGILVSLEWPDKELPIFVSITFPKPTTLEASS